MMSGPWLAIYSPSENLPVALEFVQCVCLWHSSTELQMVSFPDENIGEGQTRQLTHCSDAKPLASSDDVWTGYSSMIYMQWVNAATLEY